MEAGAYIKVARNENYWQKGLPYLDDIYLPMIPDTSVQFAMLRTGELDVMEDLDSSALDFADRNPQIRIEIAKGSRTRFIWYRLNVAPWDNKPLREAFSYATNRQVLSDVLYQGLATPAYDDISPIYGKFYDPNYKAYDLDTAKAKQKLIEAGYPNGFTYEQPCSSNPFEIQWCETLQSMYRDVGINVQLRLWQAGSYFSDFVSKKHDGPVWSGLSAKITPHLLFSRYIYSTGAGNKPYGRAYANPEVDRLIDEAAKTYDSTKQYQMYRQAAKLVVEDVATTYHVHEPLFWGVRSNVQGFEIYPDTEMRVRFLWLKKR
ncbi:MAG: ABC transporter substrate-binding protein [Chloroflexi bacterium]|nr:ABC transporter substrate-binding protein [Chloroflexota bacterium]